MFGLFKKKKTETSFFVVAQLNAKVMPIDRGERYEDPLGTLLQKLGAGEVSGGGTMLGQDKQIEYCDVEIRLSTINDDILQTIKGCLEQCGAPKGSKLKVESTGAEIP